VGTEEEQQFPFPGCPLLLHSKGRYSLNSPLASGGDPLARRPWQNSSWNPPHHRCCDRRGRSCCNQNKTVGPVRQPFQKRRWTHAVCQNCTASALFGRLVALRANLWSPNQEERSTS